MRSLLFLVPLLLLVWAFYYPNENSHYAVLGVSRDASKEEIYAAYEQQSLVSGNQQGALKNAFNVLYNDLTRRDYDNFDIDEQLQTTEPALEVGPIASSTKSLTLETLPLALEDDKPWLVQVFSTASGRCREFSPVWEELAEKLEGLVNLGRVDLGDVELAKLFAEKNLVTWRPTFHNGVPAIVAFPPGCKQLSCLSRYYSKELKQDVILDWVATRILGLPRILYYSAQTLVPELILKSGFHKVNVLIFSETGERATPYMRQVAKDYADYASFGCVLWRESEGSIWKSRLGVESAPAIVILKDPGVQPVVVHGRMNRTMFIRLIEEHKTHVLPQLRSVTARELGCDITGHSAGGENISTWYCVVAAGKPGYKLDQLRSTMRFVKDELETEENEAHFEHAVMAYKENRLALTWLDGSAQKKFCYYFLSSETTYETCGPRQYAEEVDVPRVVLIRFSRIDEEEQRLPSRTTNFNSLWQQDDENLASILVARYNGSTDEAAEIVSWISKTVEDGERSDMPSFRVSSAPVLVPEDTPPMLASTRDAVFQAKSKASERAWSLMQQVLTLKDSKLSITILLVPFTIFLLRWLY